MTETLRRIDANPVRSDAPECRAILTVRNEATRLPWVLTYYRGLGITRFFVVDNNSDDDSLAFLSQQKDCHVFSTSESFATANHGLKWQQQILEQFQGNHWWMLLDADEMLVYPDAEHVSLPEFCRYLDSVGAEGLYTNLIDMYSHGPVCEAVYTPGQSFLDVCPCFDTDYEFRPRLKAPFVPEPFPPLEPIGGPRLRRFYPEFYKKPCWVLAKAKILRRIRNLLGRFGIKLNIDPAVPPLLFNLRLLKWRSGIQLINNHMVSPIKLPPVTGAILHFKFFSDFHEKAMREAARGEHFDGGSEYKRYLKAMEREPRMSFVYEGTAVYKCTRQLVELGLIKDDPSFKTYRETLKRRE